MTTYYISLSQGTKLPTGPNVAEATSAPTADAYLVIGSGALPAASISRAWLLNALRAFIDYVGTDDPANPNRAGTGVLPLTK